MKTILRSIFVSAFVIFQLTSVFAADIGIGLDHDLEAADFDPEIVQWTGVIHSVLDNEVELEFIRSADNKKFAIINSPEIGKLDWVNHFSRLVKIKAEKTPSFLFWGGNLVVKSFEIVKDTGRYKMPKVSDRSDLRGTHELR